MNNQNSKEQTMEFPENFLRAIWKDSEKQEEQVEEFISLYKSNPKIRGSLMYRIYEMGDYCPDVFQKRFVECKTYDEVARVLEFPEDMMEGYCESLCQDFAQTYPFEKLCVDVAEEKTLKQQKEINVMTENKYNDGMDTMMELVTAELYNLVENLYNVKESHKKNTSKNNPFLEYSIKNFCETFHLPARCANVACRGREKVKDLLKCSKRELRWSEQFGEKSFLELEKALNSVGIFLKETIDED